MNNSKGMTSSDPAPPRPSSSLFPPDDDDDWLCYQPSLSSTSSTFTVRDDLDDDDDAADPTPSSTAPKPPRRQPLSLDFSDMPTLDADDPFSVDRELLRYADRTPTSHSTKRTQPSADDVVDLTDDPPSPALLPLRSHSATATFAFHSPSAQHSSPFLIPPPPVRRNITDFFSSAAVKHESAAAAISRPPPTPLQPRAAVKEESGQGGVKREDEAWKYLLTGRKAAVKSEPGRGRGARGRDRGGTPVRGGRGRYDRFTQSMVKPEPLPPPPSSPHLFASATAEEERTLEHIRRYSLRTGFRAGPCPAFKRIAGTTISVDAFQYSLAEPRSLSFFLSQSAAPPLTPRAAVRRLSATSLHSTDLRSLSAGDVGSHHSDHTVGLYRGWDIGLIYCSSITATLLVEQDGISPAVVRAIPLHQRVYVDGVYVTLIDANHCPGAVIFVFELPPFIDDAELTRKGPRLTGHGPVYVHCGDARYCKEMGQLFTGAVSGEVEAAAGSSSVEVPSAIHNHYASLYAASTLVHLSRLTITGVYLDTTYCRPVHQFPPQAEVVRYTLDVVRDILVKERRTNEKLRKQHQHSHHHTAASSALTTAWSALSSTLSPHPSSSPSPPPSFLDGYSRAQHQRTLFLVGSYSIGKEKVFLEIAREFGMKIYASPAKLRLIRQIQLFNDRNSQLITPDQASSQLMKEASATPIPYPISSSASPSSSSSSSSSSPALLSPFSQTLSWSTWDAADVLTSDIRCSRLHVVPLSYCSLLKVGEYLDPELNPEMRKIQGLYHSVVCWRPTGWIGNTPRVSQKTVEVSVVKEEEGEKKRGGKGRKKKGQATERKVVHQKTAMQVFVHHIPYSEHSNFSELTELVRVLADCGMQQGQVIPTVNVQRSEEMCREFDPVFAERRRFNTQPHR